MTTLNQYARPEWASPRKETWYEHLLPQRVTDTINQSPLVGALSKYMNSPPPDLTLPSERDSKVPMPRSPSWFDDRPIATEALDKFGLLANFIGPGAKLPPPAPKPQGFRAYHGSPHDFDKFDINKIGTGEGAQAYGRGLYFAENEGVARSYRDTLAPAGEYRYNGEPFRRSDPSHVAALRVYQFGRDDAITQLRENAQRLADEAKKFKRPQPDAKIYAQAADLIERGAYAKIDTGVSPGKMYEVKINADPEQFLDWDKPLSQQPEAVRKILTPRLADDHYAVDAPVGSILRNELLQPETAQALKEAGVPGTRYLDQNSRAKGDGSRNIVVFDDKLVEILRKYGLLPPVTAGAASMAQGQEPPL